MKKKQITANQVFIGLPWKTVKPRYERIILKLQKKYPIYFVIIGRDDGTSATDLFELIKQRIDSSSCAIFDVTGNNPNVSLEYGYAEGRDITCYLYVSTHRATHKTTNGAPILSDLGGQRRVQYKTEKALTAALTKFSSQHDFNLRYEKALAYALKGKSKGQKKSLRALSLKMIRFFDGYTKRRRADLLNHLQSEGYDASDIECILKKFSTSRGILRCSTGRYSDVEIL